MVHRPLDLAAVGPGSSLGCSAPHRTFLLRDDWLWWEGGNLNNVDGVLLNGGGPLGFG